MCEENVFNGNIPLLYHDEAARCFLLKRPKKWNLNPNIQFKALI